MKKENLLRTEITPDGGRRRDTHPQKGLAHPMTPPLLERQWLQETVLQMCPLQ